jgi:hypothetical protein
MTVSPFLALTNSGVNLNCSLPTLTLKISAAETALARAAAVAKAEKRMLRDQKRGGDLEEGRKGKEREANTTDKFQLLQTWTLSQTNPASVKKVQEEVKGEMESTASSGVPANKNALPSATLTTPSRVVMSATLPQRSPTDGDWLLNRLSSKDLLEDVSKRQITDPEDTAPSLVFIKS